MKDKILDFIDWMQYATLYRFVHIFDDTTISQETLKNLITIWEKEQ